MNIYKERNINKSCGLIHFFFVFRCIPQRIFSILISSGNCRNAPRLKKYIYYYCHLYTNSYYTINSNIDTVFLHLPTVLIILYSLILAYSVLRESPFS